MAKRKMPVKTELAVEPERIPLVSETEELPKNVKMVEVICDSLNVRERPTKESKILFAVSYGTRLIAKSLEGLWYRIGFIDDDTFEGFVMKTFTKEIDVYG